MRHTGISTAKYQASIIRPNPDVSGFDPSLSLNASRSGNDTGRIGTGRLHPPTEAASNLEEPRYWQTRLFSFYPWAVAKDELSSGDNPGCLSEEIAERSSTDRPELERRSTMAKALGLDRKPSTGAAGGVAGGEDQAASRSGCWG